MFLLIDKPQGMTSHDVIDVLRRVTGIKRIGHAGTLDPNATGLLIVGIGREATKKLVGFNRNTIKEYKADIVLGEERDTDDIEGKVLNKSELRPDKYQIIKLLKEFTGKISQLPPSYSAVKKGGRKAYIEARKGKFLDLEPKDVVVYSIKLLAYRYPLLKIEAVVSSGTYIRALARDIGRKLGTYAYLSNLRRIKIGAFSIDKAVKLDKLNSNWEQYVIKTN